MSARPCSWRAPLIGVGLAFGLCGIRWGLPSRARVDGVIPPALNTPEFHRRLMESWSRLHAKDGADIVLNPEAWSSHLTGVQRVPAGWTEPPDVLLNSVRSFHLRSSLEDEQSLLIALSRLRPWRLQMNPHLFAYGGAYIYSLGAWIGLGAVLRIASLHTSLAPYLDDPSRMASMYFTGRLLTVALYIGCALLLLRIGRRHVGADAGKLAALFFLLSPGVVVQAHVMKPPLFWSFFVLLTLDLSAGLLETGGTAAYAAAGAASGVAVGAFVEAWPACLIVAAAAALRVRALGKPARPELKGLSVAALASAGAFFATNPYWLLDTRTALGEMGVLSGTATLNVLHAVLFLIHPFARAVTLPVFLLCVAGGVWAAARGRREPALALVLFAFLAGLAMTSTIAKVESVRQTRFFIGFLAIGLLLAGRAAAELLSLKPSRRPVVLALLVLALGNQALGAATYAYNFHLDATPRSTHVEAGAWIEANVPAGSAIGLLGLPQPSNAPYFRYDRYDLRLIDGLDVFAALPAAELPRYLALVAPDTVREPLAPQLSRYERLAAFDRARLVPWISADPTATPANPLIEIYRRKETDP